MDLFGNDGTQLGCHIIYNKFKQINHVSSKFYNLNRMSRIRKWREHIGKQVRLLLRSESISKIGVFGGNHLTALPIYDEIIRRKKYQRESWSIVRFDSHLDVEKNNAPLYIGNFMWPICKKMPIINIGNAKNEGHYSEEITDKEIINQEYSVKDIRKYLTGDSLYVDFDVDVLCYRDFKSYLSHHDGGISVNGCIELLQKIVTIKEWNKIVWSVTEFCGLLSFANEDVSTIIDLTSTVFDTK